MLATRRLVWLLPLPVRLHAQQLKVGPGGQDQRGPVHYILVGDITVRKDDLIHVLVADQADQLALGEDRYPLGIELARQF
jgi:hypothetical protein